ncbi:MAG: hypothetical protein CMJ84_17930 [Planctomycetes bacterium]|jgi:hypothetical protein|nr:hypothetical protein [Planctomycetota bacterium]MDP6410428.1 hypothetical protein [Planctomycetota bacterium]
MQVIDELRRMGPERFLTIYEALAQDGFGPLDGEVAKAMRFRPHAIKKLPMAQRARRAKGIMERSANAELCYEIFGSFLFKMRKDLVLGFLDATGVEHDDGMIENTEENQPDPAKVVGAIAELDGEFPAEDVTLYLSICAEQWPATTEIQEAWQGRASVSS